MLDEKIAMNARKRYQLLKLLYEKTDASPANWINDEELQRELHVPPEEYTPMILELRSRDLADCTHESATITFAGIREVERLESNPNQGSANFPAVNVMNVYGGISQSKVQQGS